MADEHLVECVTHQGDKNLSGCGKNWASRSQSTETYNSLNLATVPFAVILEIVEDLCARYCQTADE